MLIPATQLRAGMLINYQNDLYRIMTVTHITPGNWRGMVQTKMRAVRTGTQTENRFRSEDKVDRVSLDQQEMEFIYTEGEDFHFMNTETFEQISLDREMLGDVVSYLLPNLHVTVDFYESRPIGVTPPKTVDLRVTDTAPGLKTATVTNVLKPATTETGLVVPVPNFVETGDVLRVDTESGAYLSRVKSD
ncbi:MAG: elongation factor P [Deltaproteobacteria bacterium]|nr:elongation factor P [Deltaproteobacteria bacterium]